MGLEKICNLSLTLFFLGFWIFISIPIIQYNQQVTKELVAAGILIPKNETWGELLYRQFITDPYEDGIKPVLRNFVVSIRNLYEGETWLLHRMQDLLISLFNPRRFAPGVKK